MEKDSEPHQGSGERRCFGTADPQSCPLVGLEVSGWPGLGHPALRRAFGVGVGHCLLLSQEEGLLSNTWN